MGNLKLYTVILPKRGKVLFREGDNKSYSRYSGTPGKKDKGSEQRVLIYNILVLFLQMNSLVLTNLVLEQVRPPKILHWPGLKGS